MAVVRERGDSAGKAKLTEWISIGMQSSVLIDLRANADDEDCLFRWLTAES